jgi:hypothetical protein
MHRRVPAGLGKRPSDPFPTRIPAALKLFFYGDLKAKTCPKAGLMSF